MASNREGWRARADILRAVAKAIDEGKPGPLAPYALRDIAEACEAEARRLGFDPDAYRKADARTVDADSAHGEAIADDEARTADLVRALRP